ncbi:MAG TPA: hypothetical protein G4N96_08860 [Chloroflexi bacterium]|nr:hypothetical protein [Chloroflexota bacterium]
MTAKQRPWWLLAMQMPLLDTTLKEDHRPGQKRYIIAGKPVIKNLSWIVYGPLAAIATLLAVGALTWMLNISEQEKAMKLAFVCLLGLMPMLVWAAAGVLIGKLAQRSLNREIEANAQQIEIVLNLEERALRLNNTISIPFSDIDSFKLISDAGVYYTPAEDSVTIVNLIAHTHQGQVPLLPKELGTLKQKLQLVSQLEAEVKI